MSTITTSCAIARSPAKVTKIGPSRWLAWTFRSAISFERRTNSGPLALIQLIRTTESSWKQSRICSHNPRSRLTRSRNINWVIAETSAASRTAWGKESVVCLSHARIPAGSRARLERTDRAAPHSVTSSAAGEQHRRHFKAEGLRGGQIDYKIEFGRLFDGDVCGLRPTQNLVDKVASAPEQVGEARPI